MILDTLPHLTRYRGIHPRLDQAIDRVMQADLQSLPSGRHALDGENLFAISERYTSKDPAQARLEAHRRYADIQILFAGRERMGLAPLAGLRETTPYDPARDIAFFDGPFQWHSFGPGDFAIYFPQDAHAPGASPESGAQAVHKVVIKVLL